MTVYLLSCRLERSVIMQVFAVRTNLDRVVLLVYRVRPETIRSLLPAAVVPRRLRGFALGGILVARRRDLGTRILGHPADGVYFAVHYINVVAADARRSRFGAFVIRRDTTSRLNTWLDRIAPRVGPHHAHFQFHEQGPAVALDAASDDQRMKLRFQGQLTSQLPASSLFSSIAQACDLLRDGLVRLGIVGRRQVDTPPHSSRRLCRPVPMRVTHVESSMFDAGALFAPGDSCFDSAFWLQNIEFVWRDQKQLCCDIAPA